jgi:hypothetical protein
MVTLNGNNTKKPINKEELYENLSEFLKTKGVSLQDGSYSRGIHAGCSFLADAINLSQAGLQRAKSEIEKQLDSARKIIHEKTAPKNGPSSAKGKTAGRANAPRPSPPKMKASAKTGTKSRPGGARGKRK